MASSADGERRIPCTIRLGFHLLPQPRCFCGLPSAQPCSCSDNLHTQTTGTRCAWLSPLTGAAALEKKVAQAYRDIYDTILLGMVTSLSKRPGVVDVKVKEQPGADQVRAITSLRRRRWQHRHPPSRDPLPVVVPVVMPPPRAALATLARVSIVRLPLAEWHPSLLCWNGHGLCCLVGCGFLQLQIREWQRKYGVALPADLARFMSTNDGLTMVWSIQHHGKVANHSIPTPQNRPPTRGFIPTCT